MGLFSKKKKEGPVVEQPREPTPPPNPFPDVKPEARHISYADQPTFVPTEYKPREVISQDPLEAAAQRKKARDDAILDAIFHTFARMLPTYGSQMKKYENLTTSDYAFNEGEYSDRYPELEKLIKKHMEAKGWKVKEFSIKSSNEKSKSTLSKYYPKVKWHVLEPGSFKVKK